MLIYILRHGKSTTLKTRAIRNGSSRGFGSSSKREEGGVDGGRTATGVDRIQEIRWVKSKRPKEERLGNDDTQAFSRPTPNSQPRREWKKEDRAKSNFGCDTHSEDTHSEDAQNDTLSGFQNKEDISWLAHQPKDVHSKPMASLETNSTKRGLNSGSGKAPAKNTIANRSFLDQLHEENSFRRSKGVPDGSGKTPAQGTTADSSFLDQLHEENLINETKHPLKDSISVEQKVSTLRQVMVAGNPRSLLLYMIRESEDLEFMRAIPGLTFVELLRQLQPGDEFSPLRSDYKGQGPKHYWMLSSWRRKFYKALQDRRQFYHDIVMRRMESGAELGVGEYAQLLNLARSTWDGPMALDIMKEMIANKVQPNLTCYNHYFEARCWSDAYHPSESQRLRVIPRNIEMRKEGSRRAVADDVMVDGYRVDENGIRWEITRMFDKMVREGISADTRAYCNLIIAQSREGDLRAIKSVLQQVWNVNIDELLAGAPDFDEQRLHEDSPTYPTGDLLFTLAHAFGSNNLIPAAIRIVDHFSRKYQIVISQAVWGELLEWTFVLSAPRRKKRLSDGTSTGQLPLSSVERVFNVMLGPPYHGKPTLRMYDFVIRSFWRRPLHHRTLYDFIDRMREGVKFHEQAFDAFADSRTEMASMLENNGAIDPMSLDSQQVEVAKAWNDRWYSFVLVRKWLDLLLSNPRWLRNEEERERKWTRKLLPDTVREFWRYKAHKPFKYLTATGRVELEDPVEEETWAMRSIAKESNIGREMEEWEARSATWLDAGDYVEDSEGEIDSVGVSDAWDKETGDEQEQAEEENHDEETSKRRDDP